MPVSCASDRVSRKTVSSSTAWIEAAKSISLGQQALGIAGRAAEQRVELRIRHAQAGAIVEILEIEPERAVGLEVDEMIENFAGIARRPIGSESHDLVLGGIHLEARIVGERGIQHPNECGK
jgi:hypothetical protein